MASSFKLIPVPASIQNQVRVNDLKARLDWGEPALTIIDVRNRDSFNSSHITGAIPVPAQQLVEIAMRNLELVRDIYVYDETDEQTTTAAQMLRDAGYQNVAELVGGLKAWKSAGYPVEEIVAM